MGCEVSCLIHDKFKPKLSLTGHKLRLFKINSLKRGLCSFLSNFAGKLIRYSTDFRRQTLIPTPTTVATGIQSQQHNDSSGSQTFFRGEVPFISQRKLPIIMVSHSEMLLFKTFSDGEMQPIINESVRGDYVFLIQSTFAPSDNLMELLLMIDACKRASAGYITAVIPYFGYARQDRKDKPRVPISAKLIADIIQAAGANRIMTMDFHADQIQGFFNIPVDHLKSEAIYIPYLQEQDLSNTIFCIA